jgi:hypothetical protein
MSDYFDYSTGRLADGVTARASLWNTVYDEIDTGLDKLPTEAQLKRGTVWYGTDTGAADAYVVAMPYAPASYVDGSLVIFKASGTNTGAATINVNSLGVKSITRQSGATLEAADIVSGKFTILVYNSTSGKFEVVSSTADAQLASLVATVETLESGVGTKVSADDTTVGFVEGKITSADGSVAMTTLNPGANEIRDLSVATYVSGQTSGKLSNVVEDTTPQAGGEFDFQAHSAGFTLQTATGDGTTTIDWRLGNKFKFTFGAMSETFTFTAPSKPCSLTLVMIQDGGGSRVPTFPTIKWANGITPVWSTTGGAIDIASFFYDGSTYYGMAGTGFATP